MRDLPKNQLMDIILQTPAKPVERRVLYRGKSIVAVMASWNEAGKVAPCVEAVPRDIVDAVCVVDNGSTDGTGEEARKAGAYVVAHPVNIGAGGGYRSGYFYGYLNKYDIIVELAGDNQDDPNDIKQVVDCLLDNGYDYVQGSRWMPGGAPVNMTFSRSLLTRLYSTLFTLIYRTHISDATNGFRAFYSRLLDDNRINLWQGWLIQYELEPYLLIKTVSLGYRVGQAPVKKIYHADMRKNTKMVPFKSWYSIIRPVFLIPLGLKK